MERCAGINVCFPFVLQRCSRNDMDGIVQAGTRLRKYFQEIMLSSGLEAFMNAIHNKPQVLPDLLEVVMQNMQRDSPTADSRRIDPGQRKKLHPAMTTACLSVITPGDVSCLFHAISMAICGTTALTHVLCVLSAIYFVFLPHKRVGCSRFLIHFKESSSCNIYCILMFLSPLLHESKGRYQ